MVRLRWAEGALVLAAGFAATAHAAPPGPSAPDAPSAPFAAERGSRSPMKLDVDARVDALFAREHGEGPLRFEETIEVRDRLQEALESQLRGTDLGCGASATGPPTRHEMHPYRSAVIPVHADFLPAAKLIVRALASRLHGGKPPRYFLYAVRRDTGRGTGSVVFLVRDGALPESRRAAVPGTTWDLVSTFREPTRAAAALRRLERGFPGAERAHPDDPLPPWVATTCRPPGIE